MKRSFRLFALLLALVILIPCAAAEDAAPATEETAFVFRNSVTWDTPAEAIAQAEGVEETAFSKFQSDTLTGYTLQGVLVEAMPAVLSYYYQSEQLVAVWCMFKPIPAFGFDAWLAYYTGEYGEPTEFDTETVAALFNAVTPGALDEDEVLQLAGWLLSDGTRVYLHDIDGNLSLSCFNAPELLR